MGDGPKWVCDPHRIAQKTSNCLVYSIGSFGHFGFEESVLSDIHPECEIHTFDPELQGESFAEKAPKMVHYHAWGLGSGDNTDSTHKYMTLNDTVTLLGHAGRTIDIFKIDCEGCEFSTFDGWFDADINLKQILVEVHGTPSNVNDLFRRLQHEGYVTFHKEPNIKNSNLISSTFMCVEYAFLKLNQDFFRGMNFIVQDFAPVPAPTLNSTNPYNS